MGPAQKGLSPGRTDLWGAAAQPCYGLTRVGAGSPGDRHEAGQGRGGEALEDQVRDSQDCDEIQDPNNDPASSRRLDYRHFKHFELF